MASQSAHEEIKSILSMNNDQKSMIERLEKLVEKQGIESIAGWRNSENKTKNTLIHELVERNCLEVIQYLACKHSLEINIHREVDGKTPIDLTRPNNAEMQDLLEDLAKNQMEQVVAEDDDSEPDLRRRMNIVWVDLEMTSIEDPKIMECAVIITDRNLKVLERAEWVVHYDQSVIDTLGTWHQEQFKSVADGGNGLFDDCIKSKLSEADVEEALLKIIQRYCPEKECPLAGSSIHIDKEVLKLRMPKVHNYLHYRIIDVSSFRAMLRRWAPAEDQKFTSKLSQNGGESVSHRAMDDIKYSIELMKLFRPLLAGNSYHRRNPNSRPIDNNLRRDPGEASAVPKNNRSIGNFETERSKYFADEKTLLARLEVEKKMDVKSLRLDKKTQNIYDRNPHLRETFFSQQTGLNPQKTFDKSDRFLNLQLSSSSNRRAPNRCTIVTTEHWGTRKIMLTDIEFLTNYGRKGKFLVIYVGAAPGLHINALSEYFPNLEFVLIDSKKVETKKTAKIHVRSFDYMNEIVNEYGKSNKNLLLICDIHTFTTSEEMDDNMVTDIKTQISWHSTMMPVASLLTFPIPRSKSKIEYFKGDLILEPWGSRTSNCCRLVVAKEARLMDYDVKQLKGSMDHFQNVLRTTYYQHELKDSNTDGLDHCYDCRSEIFILGRYLEKVQGITDVPQQLCAVSRMSNEISNSIQDKNRPPIVAGTRTLAVIPKK